MTHCDICDELIFAWRSLPIASEDRWEIWEHAQTCAVARASYERACAQLDTLTANAADERSESDGSSTRM